MGNGPRDSLRGSSLEVAKCGRIIIVVVIIILIIFIIISIITIYVYIYIYILYSIMLLMEEILYPVDMPKFYVSQLVQDLFHELYLDGFCLVCW